MKKTAVFLGRFSPFQKGHVSVVEKMIAENGTENCLVMIGSTNALNERTPYTYEQRAEMIKTVFPNIKTMPLPDGKPGQVYFDGSTNDMWLDKLEKIQKELDCHFVFYGGSAEDLKILSERFETVILVDRAKKPEITATNVREALDKNDQEVLETLLDSRVIPLAKKYYQKYKENHEKPDGFLVKLGMTDTKHGLPRPAEAGLAMAGTKGVKFAMAQIEVVAGRPDLNSAKILREIEEAKKRNVDVIIFSEMVVPGYLLGDEWENDAFIRDLMGYNQDILKASQGITVIWGNVYAETDKIGEDGRMRKYNAVYLAQDGKWLSNGVFEGHTFKTLMPKYREFDDERHFYSLLRLANEMRKPLNELLKPFKTTIRGEEINIGAMLCEDMWSDDYADSPTEVLANNGAEVIVNLSCSPWTWRKNNKRNRVVKALVEKVAIPFLYCNNVGVQNNGKNIFLFDGNSTAYNKNGEVVKQAKDYKEETVDIEWSEIATVRSTEIRNDEWSVLSDEKDVRELYDGLVYGLKRFFESNKMNKAVLGLSGGVDSAVSACLLADAIGRENVFAVNMPSKFNSDLTKNAAMVLAKNLGINYGVFPIQEGVDLTVKELKEFKFERLDKNKKITNIEVTGYGLENIQARDRGGRVLAGISACLGAVFTNNGNKTETTIGWCTLYGDVNGAIAPIADIYKSEVYQLARYMNKLAGTEIIPAEILNVIPSAELSEKQDVTKGLGDPILYPYHDRLFRSFVEFRRDPEYILNLYIKGELENELKIETGLVKKYFPTDADFVQDLEHKWRQFKINIFKRIQAPPIIAVSRRAFGFDLREAQNGVYFTREYTKMKKELLGMD